MDDYVVSDSGVRVWKTPEAHLLLRHTDTTHPSLRDKLAETCSRGRVSGLPRVLSENSEDARTWHYFGSLLQEDVVGDALGVARRVLLRVHRGHEDLLLVVRQAGAHVREAQEYRVPDDVEQRAGNQSGPLPDHLAELAPATVAPVLHRVVVGLADGDLLEAVPLNPAVLVGAPELRPDFRREPIEEMEDGRRVAAEQRPGQAEGLAADVGEDARGDALGAPSPLE